MVFGSEFFGDQAGVRGLIELLVLKPDRKSLHRLCTGSRHQRDNGGRIRPAAQQRAQWDI